MFRGVYVTSLSVSFSITNFSIFLYLIGSLLIKVVVCRLLYLSSLWIKKKTKIEKFSRTRYYFIYLFYCLPFSFILLLSSLLLLCILFIIILMINFNSSYNAIPFLQHLSSRSFRIKLFASCNNKINILHRKHDWS